MAWASELPSELLVRPTGLTILTGLDTTYNAVHKAIWDSFCNNRRPDRVPLQFIVQGVDHEYPKCRSKRTSYEWYIPKGIVKTSWLKKHLEQIPAVIVVFFDLDWDETMWKEKQMECATKVQIIRDSLSGRGTRVCVVLIQKNAPLPPGEDMIAAERAASLCSACELSAKSLFVLPLTDHLLGYTIRLENAFYELAQGYYHTEGRRVKAHKEFLNKTTHQFLFVRHQFKIAFFNEMKQDSHTALKHYKQAYGHILDLRMHDTNLMEVKTIAGFINYKICRLSFQHNAPLDAIAQFRKHIDFFKGKIGHEELTFEHSAWMSKQFQVFGELFDEAIKLGLTAIQTQHPGFYFQQAANHAINRKQAKCMHQKSGQLYPSPDPLEQLDKLDYYGQRPWRQGHQSIDPPDLLKEKDGMQALQILELKVDHSSRIIPLLSSAVAQFKKYKSPRMKRFLMVNMGEECYHAKDFTKALTLLCRVMWDYRQERWWTLLTSILNTALRCAYLEANVEQYITLSLELIGKYMETSREEKTRIQTNLIRVMAKCPPEEEPGCPTDCLEKAKALWAADPTKDEPCIFTVEMHNIFPFVECKACFADESFTADNPVVIQLFLRTSCPFPIRFSKLSLLLNNQAYSQHCVIVDSHDLIPSVEETSGDLYLSPGQTKVHTFSFLPHHQDVGKMLEITSVVLELGGDSQRCAILHWSGGGGDSLVPSPTQLTGTSQKPRRVTEVSGWENLQPRATARIAPRPSQLSITLTHKAPCLVNEFYKVSLLVENRESTTIENVKLSVALKEGQDSSMDLTKMDKLPLLTTAHVSIDQPQYDDLVVSKHTDLAIENLQPGQSITRMLYVKCLEPGDRTITAQVSYDIMVAGPDGSFQCSCSQIQSAVLPTVNPFDISVKLASMQLEPIVNVHADETFLLLVDVKCSSPWPIHISDSTVQLSEYIKVDGEDIPSQVAGVSLKCGDCASEVRCLVAPPAISPTVPVGNYTVTWRRKSDPSDSSETTTTSLDVPYVTSTTPLPTVTVEHIPLFVDVDIPACGSVRQSLPATYNVHNRTPYSQEVEITVETSEGFMFAGQKQVHFRILPESKHELRYNFVPLLPGNVPLPKMRLNMLRYPNTMDGLVAKMLPTHVYVRPSGKSLDDIQPLINSFTHTTI